MHFKTRSSMDPDTLFLKVLVVQAQNVGANESNVNRNLFVSLNFNDQSFSTDKVKSVSEPQWDQHVNFLLNKTAKSSTLTATCWDRDVYGTTYMGETRINLIDVLGKPLNTLLPSEKDGKRKAVKVEPKWFKLYSSQLHQTFVTGTVQLGFQLYGKKSKRDGLKSIISKSKTRSDVAVGNIADVKKPSMPIIVTSPQTARGPSPPYSRAASPLVSSVTSLVPENEDIIAADEMIVKWNKWVDNLAFKDTIKPNDQGFYVNNYDLYSLNQNYETEYTVDDLSKSENDSAVKLAPSANKVPNSSAMAIKLEQDDVSDYSDTSDISSIGSDYSGGLSDPESSQKTSGLGINNENNLSTLSSDTSSYLTPPDSKLKMRRRRRLKTKKLRKSQKKPRGYQLSSFTQVKGVLFLEIISASDLPPFKSFTRTSFDMDPFVVVSFGKRTFRTSWRKHTLNPVFNERLAFEVLNRETNFDIQLSILDKDAFTFHDRVADITIPISDIIDMSTKFLIHGQNDSNESIPSFSDISARNSEAEDNGSIRPKTLRSGLLRKKIKPQKVLPAEQEERFLKFDLPLEFSEVNSKYKEKYHPILKIQTRFELYEKLRQDFWRHLLKSYDMNDDNCFSYLELSAFLDILGSTLSHSTIINFFKKYNKGIDNDSLTVDEVVCCLEELISKKQRHVDNDSEESDMVLLRPPSPSESTGDIIKIDYCPVCGKSRLSKKDDLDIITHVAICASKDWSSVDRLIKSTYVSPSYATKRWYSKVFIKLGYGKVALGSNNANILVQDRYTGVILEEKMSAYVRLGIRLLYRGSTTIQRRQAKKLLRKLSIKQGKYFDNPKSAKDIPSFVKFHKLDLTECLLPIEEYNTFNEFFYRKLVPDARPVEAVENENIICSAADSRCTTFNSVSAATKIWIKGNGFTIPKLFAGKHPEIMNLFATNCSVAIFRLAPQDYHRFHSPVDGIIGEPQFIDGEYYTVNPMAIRSHLDVFGENIRCILPIETKPFGTVVVVPVGAMMVGSTILTVKTGQEIKRGEELGYFKFGGSTLLVLFQPNSVLFDSDLVSNSMQGIETLVKVGMSIGHKIDVEELAREKKNFDNEPEYVKLRIIRTITGGGGALADAQLGDIHNISWEASNLKISSDLSDVNKI